MLTFPRNRRKATPMGMEWEKGVFVDNEVRQGGQTRWGLAGSCKDFGFTLSNPSSQQRENRRDMA